VDFVGGRKGRLFTASEPGHQGRLVTLLSSGSPRLLHQKADSNVPMWFRYEVDVRHGLKYRKAFHISMQHRTYRSLAKGAATISTLFLVAVLLPSASASYAVFYPPFTGSSMTAANSVSSVGTGSNTVIVAPSFTLSTGVVLESISSKATGATATDNFHETSLAGLVGIFWTCVGATCGLPRSVILTWSLQGGATGVTSCPSGLGTGTINADSAIKLSGSVLSTTGGTIGSTSSTIASALQPGCPGSTSAPLSGTYTLTVTVVPVGPFTGTQTWTITATVNLDTQANGNWATTTPPVATATGNIVKGSSLTSVTIV
jgi:hypothetical protein